ncbi:hypothetical protein [Agreia sp. VKM Ac-1783]|nr:hypothetical protein [Agreia sp. VKM Ac-1783]SMQ71808.1 hypothetical protein SAMN06295943_2696 [Agreia sp. VKM Ac-1783]
MTNEHPIPRDPGKKTVDEKEETVLEDLEESLPTEPEPTDGPAPGA